MANKIKTKNYHTSLNILRFIIALAIIWYLFKQNIIDLSVFHYVFKNIPGLLLAILLCAGIIPIGAFRWWLLLRSQQCHISLLSIYHIYATATLSNNLLPGAMGGDAVKALYLLKYNALSRTKTIMSIVSDRIIGLLALLSLTFGLLLSQHNTLLTNQKFELIFQVLFAFLLISILGIISISLLSEIFLTKLTNKNITQNRTTNFLEALVFYKKSPLTVAICLLIAVIMHSMLVASIILLADIIDIKFLSSLEVAVASALSMIANIIPITPGGVGIGEASFEYICRMINNANLGVAYGSVFLVFRITFLLSSLIGLYSFLVHRFDSEKDAHLIEKK